MKEIIKEAFKLIDKALELNEIPVAAIIFDPQNYQIIAKSCNMTYTLKDASAHAEIVAIREAGKAMDCPRLDGLAMYVTLEPCAMCAGAIAHSGLSYLFFGAYDIKGGAVENGVRFFNHSSALHKISVQGGIEQEKSANILKSFFKEKRKTKKIEKNKIKQTEK